MPIEFRCNECDHLLRTPDEAAGKKARCPSCQNIQDVPGGQTPLAETPASNPLPPVAAPTQPPVANPVSTQSNPFAGAPSNPYATPTGENAPARELALRRARPPAIILLVFTILSILFYGLALIGLAMEVAEIGWDDENTAGVVMVAVSTLFGLFVIAGAIQMIQLKSHGLAMVAMALAIAPITCQFCVTLPFAIWGMVVLLDANVKSEFE